MRKYCPAILVALAGIASVTPLFAVVCGESMTVSGAKCATAHENPPEPPGTCERDDGGCVSVGCTGTDFGVAVDGACKTGSVSEVPTDCLENAGTTTLEIAEYSARCISSDNECRCVWSETGETREEEVCNCEDL